MYHIRIPAPKSVYTNYTKVGMDAAGPCEPGPSSSQPAEAVQHIEGDVVVEYRDLLSKIKEEKVTSKP